MAPDVPSKALMEDPTRMGDDNSDEGSDPTREIARLSKGKSIKQSIGIHQDEEPISHNHFKDLTHVILKQWDLEYPKSHFYQRLQTLHHSK